MPQWPWWNMPQRNLRWQTPPLKNYYYFSAADNLSTVESSNAPYAPYGIRDATESLATAESIDPKATPHTFDYVTISESVDTTH